MRADAWDSLFDSLFILAEHRWSRSWIKSSGMAPDLAVVDSIQAVYASGMSRRPATWARSRSAPHSFSACHDDEHPCVHWSAMWTKSGLIAGPRVLEATSVDTVR